MYNTKILKFLQSFVFIPLLATSLGVTPDLLNKIDQTAAADGPKSNIVDQNSHALSLMENNQIFNEEALIELRAGKIDSYFKRRGLPLAGYGKEMVEQAIKNDIDWRIIPAIAMRESTGGKFACEGAENNPFGWGSCKISFKSLDDAIATIAKNLGGNNRVTSAYYDTELKEALDNYNGRAVPGYSDQVLAIMKSINPVA